MIRLIALDIDGTLLDSAGRLPEENVRALSRAIDAGIEIVLATGRRFDFARPVFERLPGPLTLILSNGAIVKTLAGETLLRHLLPRAVARDVLAAVPDHRDRAALLFDRHREGQIVYERVEWDHPMHHRFFAANREFISEVAPLEAALTEDPMQLLFTGGCGEMRALFEMLQGDPLLYASGLPVRDDSRPLAAQGVQSSAGACPDGRPIAAVAATSGPFPGGPRYSVALTEYVHRDFSLVDIIRAGCSKGAALQEWAQRRGIAPADIMAVGDNLNDLQMLELVGYPVVMGNALDELKSRGWRLTASNDAAGVAVAIEEILEARESVQSPGDGTH